MSEPIDEGIASAARHGSYCPKMCTYACPVTSATGRDDAVPWSFHRTVVELVDGRLRPEERVAAARLTACSGCLACQVPCEFDQDVPAQVRAGRRILADAGNPVDGLDPAVDATRRGRSPYPGRDVVTSAPPSGPNASMVLLASCRDEPAAVTAAHRLLTASGTETAIVTPEGCCGATLGDLGAAAAAAAARERLSARLEAVELVLVLDPHCLPDAAAAAPSGATVRTVLEELDGRLQQGSLAFAPAEREVSYHDPCLLARRDGATEAPRNLLRAAGARLVEPEHSGDGTRCSGAGLAMELVDPDAAAATAAQRRAELARGAPVTLTGCSGARHLLDDGVLEVGHVLGYLAEHLGSGT